ncbi:putative NAD(P)-binding protein [Seiridium unicorne]|uniref:NAD(P)-binding protein n=1 Tax=Seiridium unicorne TaxID=138068 RepID=A0ABR2UGC8_9PEZI
MTTPFIAIAGATGAMGKLIVSELCKRSVVVKALVRPGTDHARIETLRQLGTVTVAEVDLADKNTLTRELQGARCVVSSLQGLADVILTAQGQLLDSAVAAKVPRFIPSDFSLDFTKTQPGSNRNLDLRREFHSRLDQSNIAWTSILNGGFMDLLTSETSLIDKKKRKITYVGSADQKLDFTTMVDTAAYTAAVATDPNPTPKFLRIAGDVFSANDLAKVVTTVEGSPFSVSSIGGLWLMELIISVMKRLGGSDQTMPVWQGMQYLTNMFSGQGKLEPLDNDRYPDIKWTKVGPFLRRSYNKD